MNHSELLAARELRRQLGPADSMITSIRFSDPRHGDVEADIILLLADHGAAVIEVKGGTVAYVDGVWTTGSSSYRRRTNPVEQARRAKHALRRYLDRQPEWQHGLLHAEWFVVMPQTAVTGDLGPEGLRSHLIGEGDLGSAVDQMRSVLAEGLGPQGALPPDWQDEALSLLLRRRVQGNEPVRRRRALAWLLASSVAAAGVAGAIHLRSQAGSPSPTAIVDGPCHPGYDPCLPLVEDLDCPDVGVQVAIVGEDAYGLDRDGDGLGCETGTG